MIDLIALFAIVVIAFAGNWIMYWTIRNPKKPGGWVGRQPPPPATWTVTKYPKNFPNFHSRVTVEGYVMGWSEQDPLVNEAGTLSSFHVGISAHPILPIIGRFFVKFIASATGHRMRYPFATGHVRQIHIDKIPELIKKAGRRKIKLTFDNYRIKDGHRFIEFDGGIECPIGKLVEAQIID
jgi:hypothetical protein